MIEDMLLIMNPTSKGGRAKRNWIFLRDFKRVITSSRENAIETVLKSAEKIIVSVGGDGTINQCVNGIMKSDKEKILGILYSGTSPDFCKFHNIPTVLAQALDTLKKKKFHAVDVCKIIFGNKEECYFSSSCNIGLGAKIAKISDGIRKYVGDFLGTFIAVICGVLTAKTFDAEIEADEEKINFQNLYHLFVVKNNYIASGLKLKLKCKPDDGKIYVVPVKKQKIIEAIKIIVSLYKGDFHDENTIACEKVSIDTNPKQYIEFDGGNYPQTVPVKIECMKKALKLIK